MGYFFLDNDCCTLSVQQSYNTPSQGVGPIDTVVLAGIEAGSLGHPKMAVAGVVFSDHLNFLFCGFDFYNFRFNIFFKYI